MMLFEKGCYSLDPIQATFEGYTNGDTWNGFACPYFEKDVAESILKASEDNGYQWRYDPEQDVFLVQSKDDPPEYEPEEYQGQTISIDSKEVRVYGIGTYSWI